MKKQFLTLALLATVAVGGAFASNSARDLVLGARFNASAPCGDPVANCSNISGPPCTIEINSQTEELYTHSIPVGTCTYAVYEIQP